MQLLDLTHADLPSNLALDEALLLEAEAGRVGPVLRLWEWPTNAVVLGAAGSLAIDVNEADCCAAGVPIARRSSGGGTVLIGSGCLLYSVVLPYDLAPRLNEILPSIRYVLSRLANALRAIVPEVAFDGISDLTLQGRKFSGNSQQRKRRCFLHHGTLLCGFELDHVGRFLNAPERSPDYRQGRIHSDFLTNLPCTAEEIRHRLVKEWAPTGSLSEVPWKVTQELVAEKFGREEWVRRR